MKHFIHFLMIALMFVALIIACENHKDPFSAANDAPEIQSFSFDNDSLKFTGKPPFDLAQINLKYGDNEKQPLTASFKFLSGGGTIVHGLFTVMQTEKNVKTYQIPGEFDSDKNGRLIFVPDSTGLVEIELEISDGVKTARKSITAFFFRNLRPRAAFTTRLQSNVAPYSIEVDGSASRDRDAGEIEWYYWTFGDGSATVKTHSKVFQHQYQQAGTYSLRLKVADDEGGVDSTEAVITTNNQSPLAILQVSPLTGKAPLDIEYTATNSTDPDGDVVSYRVDFGDGASSLDSAGVHTFSGDDNYRVKLTIQDNLGRTDTSSVQVIVSTPPVAMLSLTPTTGAFPLDVDIDATASFDPQGGEVEHDIFIDGKLEYDNVSRVTHTFDAEGSYLVRLIVTNKRNGRTAEVSEFVTVTSVSPVAVLNVTPTSGAFPLNVSIDARDSSDPRGGELEHDIYIDGQLVYDNVAQVNHTFDAPENYTIRLVVKSKLTNLTAETQQFVNVTNTNPVANFNWVPQTPQHQTPVTFTSASFDPNLTDNISFYRWTFPLGIVVEGVDKSIVIQPFDAGVDTFRVKLEVWDSFRGGEFEGYDSITKIVPKN